MGHIWVKVKLRNPWKGLVWEGEGLVDTDATRTAIPLRLAEELKLEKIRDVDVTTASGAAKGWLAYAEVEMLGDRTIDRVVVLDGLKHVLIGVLTLEALDLKIDPTTGRVERREILVL